MKYTPPRKITGPLQNCVGHNIRYYSGGACPICQYIAVLKEKSVLNSREKRWLKKYTENIKVNVSESII